MGMKERSGKIVGLSTPNKFLILDELNCGSWLLNLWTIGLFLLFCDLINLEMFNMIVVALE